MFDKHRKLDELFEVERTKLYYDDKKFSIDLEYVPAVNLFVFNKLIELMHSTEFSFEKKIKFKFGHYQVIDSNNCNYDSVHYIHIPDIHNPISEECYHLIYLDIEFLDFLIDLNDCLLSFVDLGKYNLEKSDYSAIHFFHQIMINLIHAKQIDKITKAQHYFFGELGREEYDKVRNYFYYNNDNYKQEQQCIERFFPNVKLDKQKDAYIGGFVELKNYLDFFLKEKVKHNLPNHKENKINFSPFSTN